MVDLKDDLCVYEECEFCLNAIDNDLISRPTPENDFACFFLCAAPIEF